jgi:uncharacterized protein
VPGSAGTEGDPGALAEAALTERERAALARPDAYPEDDSAGRSLESIQTHLSYVFLTGQRVYKFRKALDLGFVCFASRAERNADCLREVVLNRRLAPDVYLGVAPLLPPPPLARVGPIASNLSAAHPGAEHCVVMRRLPEGGDALSRLQRGRLSAEQIDRTARRLARFHAGSGLGAPAPFTPAAWRARCTDPVHANLEHLAAAPETVAPRDPLAQLAQRVLEFEEKRADLFERRRIAGRAVDGHGDLHLQHVWFEAEDAEPLIIDCLEFSESLRRIDAASDIAFLAMDLCYRDAPALAARFTSRYAAESDDYDLYALIDYYTSYRAAVRAKVAAIAFQDEQIEAAQRERSAESAKRHLELARQALAPKHGGRLILVGGAVGTGKTTVAATLAQRIEAVVIASDRVRKHTLGLEASERAPADSYTPKHKARVYAGLLDRAEAALASGRDVVLDATYGSRRERQAVREWASCRAVPVRFVESQCAPDVARARLARRAAAGSDASDAGPALHAPSLAGFEPLTEWPAAERWAIATDTDIWHAQVERIGDALRTGA